MNYKYKRLIKKMRKKIKIEFRAGNIEDILNGSNNGTLTSDEIREVKIENFSN